MPATVADAMVHRPLVCPSSLTVSQARALLHDDHLHAILVLDGRTLLAVVERDDLEQTADPAGPARYAGRLAGRTVAPDVDLERTRLQLVRSGRRRLAVIDQQNELLGLLCLKRTGLGFCSDADVEARAADLGRLVPPVGLEPTLRPF